MTLAERLDDPVGAGAWLLDPASRALPGTRVAVLRLLGRLDEACAEGEADLRGREPGSADWARASLGLASVEQDQGRPAAAERRLAGVVLAGCPVRERALAWQDLATLLRAAGGPRRGEALLAAVTALSLRERAGDELSGQGGELVSSQRLVADLSGPVVVPMRVSAGAAPADGPAGTDPDEARASWLGAPPGGVLAMLGWVVSAEVLRVVRLVVPRTGRGRRAAAPLLAALPRALPVEAQVPATDRDLLRACRRAGLEPDPAAGGSVGDRGRGRYRGGSLLLTRLPASGGGP